MVQLKKKKKKGWCSGRVICGLETVFFLVSFHPAADWVLSMYSLGSRHGYKG